MSETEGEQQDTNEELVPEDLRPGEDNPLAEPLEDEVDPDELDMHGGKTADESEDESAEDDHTDEGEGDSDPE